MIEVKQTSIKLPKDLLIAIKARAVEKGTTQNNIITDILTKEFKPTGNRKAKLINDKLPKLEGKAEDLEDLAGFVELNYETNAVELKNSIHTDKTSQY
jgi:hypothetical protein